MVPRSNTPKEAMQRHQLLAPATLLAALSFLSAPTNAQCVGDDNLSGPCCDLVTPNLPAFPNWNSESTNICWTECVPAEQCSRISVGAPTPNGCASYFAQFTQLDCLGNPILSGLLQMEYTRTWEELTPGVDPNRLQVWRFAVRADLSLIAGAIADDCMVPPSLGPYPTAYYYGYADYAFDCDNNQWEQSLVLFHNCDEFIHDQLISGVPGTFNPDRTYGIVAPDTAANPFVPANLTPPVGPITAEATRLVAAPGIPCVTEEPITGDMQFLGDGCGCDFALTPKQLNARRMVATGACGSSFTTLDLWPTYPWYHLMTTSIGTWSTDAAYPGPEQAWVDEGAFLYNEGCDGTPYGEVYYGGSTSVGYDVVVPFGSGLTQNFTDLAANVSFSLPGGPTGPLVGFVMPSRKLIYVNVP